MDSLIRFTAIFLTLAAAFLATLAVAGVLSSSELWDNLAKVVKVVAILFIASGLVLGISKK